MIFLRVYVEYAFSNYFGLKPDDHNNCKHTLHLHVLTDCVF